MNNLDFVIFQAAVLGLVAAIGMLFTFALPAPSHKHKAQSPCYGRLFLLCMWLGHVCLSVRHVDFPLVYVIGYNFFMVASAYFLYITVLKRYGHALRPRSMMFIILHIIVMQLAGLYFYWINDSETVRDLILLVSLLVPLGLATLHIKHYLAVNRSGDCILFAVLISTLGIVLTIAPVYLFVLAGGPFEQTLVSFGLILILMMAFMLGFSVSVMHSLVNRLRSQIYQDALTGCKNRHFFYDAAPQLCAHALRRNQHLSVVMCDIDHFKTINDKYGHLVGDETLKGFATLLQAQLRSEDALIRMGGEEFLILSPNCDIHQAQALAERLRETVSEQPIRYEDVSVPLTASFGVVEIHQHSDIFKGLGEADKAMYKAKSSGRNRVITLEA